MLPPGAMSAGVILEPGVVTMAIQRLWKERKFSGTDVVMGVASSHVVVRAIDLPWVEPEDLRKSLPYLVSDVLPIPVEDVLLDFLPFETGAGQAASRSAGLLVAAPRDHVNAMVRCAEKAGLNGRSASTWRRLRCCGRPPSARPPLSRTTRRWRLAQVSE